MTSAPTTDGYLGPAEVLAVGPGRLSVRLVEADGAPEVQATLALAAPVVPSPGDTLLVLGQGREVFAIGVLSGAGPVRLELPGDVELRAVGGTLSLHGERGVTVEGDAVTLRARALRTFAGTLTERVDTAFRWVKDQLRIQAGESRRIVQGEDLSHCQRSVTLAQETAKLDGHQIQIGH